MKNKSLRKYMSEIGKRGGKKSRCSISPEQQAKMQAGRGKSRLRKGGGA